MRNTDATPARLLITGAAGIVGSALRPQLRERFDHLLLSDREAVEDLAANESYAACELSDPEGLSALVKQVDAVVHLGALVGAAHTFEETLEPNVVGTRNILEAARREGVRRVVNASSHHVVGFSPRGQPLDHRAPLRPNGEYAVTKAYGEAAASYYADNFGLEILSIRIGYVGNEVNSERRLRTWVSPRDLARLVEIGLTSPGLRHEVVYGVSESPEPAFFDNRNAFRLGYQPQDQSVDQVTDPAVPDTNPNLNTIEEGVVGGGFAAVGFEGDAAKVLKRDQPGGIPRRRRP